MYIDLRKVYFVCFFIFFCTVIIPSIFDPCATLYTYTPDFCRSYNIKLPAKSCQKSLKIFTVDEENSKNNHTLTEVQKYNANSNQSYLYRIDCDEEMFMNQRCRLPYIKSFDVYEEQDTDLKNKNKKKIKIQEYDSAKKNDIKKEGTLLLDINEDFDINNVLKADVCSEKFFVN